MRSHFGQAMAHFWTHLVPHCWDHLYRLRASLREDLETDYEVSVLGAASLSMSVDFMRRLDPPAWPISIARPGRDEERQTASPGYRGFCERLQGRSQELRSFPRPCRSNRSE